MRGNIIEELYYGNIDPQDRGYSPKSPVKKASDSLNDLEEMIDVFSKDGCEMVDILFDRFLKKYYADIDVSNERMTINLTDEEGHVLSFNLSQSEVHYVLHMVERRLNSFMRDDGGGGFSDED